MKYLKLSVIIICLTVFTAGKESISPIYQFKVKDINGKEFSFESLKGKKILIINTGSKCMFAPQLYDLQQLYTKYKSKNFIIVAFPSNSFANREPLSNKEIAEKYSNKYGITFPVMQKVEVKGESIAAIYKYLTTKSLNGINDNPVKWNFQKYLINSNGFLEKAIDPKIKPLDKEITDWIEK